MNRMKSKLDPLIIITFNRLYMYTCTCIKHVHVSDHTLPI